jgi:transglutaminase-like putative cysteine protease
MKLGLRRVELTRNMTTAWIFSALAALCAMSTAHAQDTGYTWLVDRQTYTFSEEGLWVGVFEAERKAHDAQAARNGGRIDISYPASLQKIEILEAATLKADGRRLPVADDRIIDIAPQVAREVALYTDLRTRSIVFPDVEAGDTIHYVYRLTQLDRTWPSFSWSVFWRDSARTVMAERIFDRPSAMPLSAEHHGGDYRVETAGDRVRQVFSWSNARPAPEEAGSTSSADWGARFSVSAFGSYEEIGDHYASLHNVAAAVTPQVAALAEEIVGSTTDRAAQARLLFDWVARNIRYVAVSIGQGKLTPNVASETIRHRYGDCKAHVALLAALLAARGISTEPAFININVARYTLPHTPVADFNHVVLYVPELDLYLDSTSQHSSFGTLPWGHYGKPVLHAVAGKSRILRVPSQRADDNVGETHTIVTIWSDGRMTGTTQEKARGATATDLGNQLTGAAQATAQLRHFGSPGTGKWTKRSLDRSAASTEFTAEFKLADEIDLAAGEALMPPAGLRFLVRPGAFLLGTHDVPRAHPFPCYAGRQIETIEVILPTGLRPTRLPADRAWNASIAEYSSTYAIQGNTLRVRREFVARPPSQVCSPEQSQELVGFLSNVRRDQRSVVVFDQRL